MRWFALLTLTVLSATACAGSNAGEAEAHVTGTIAFVRGGQVWVMKADGTGQRALTRGDTPAWSPDGRRIAYSRERNRYSSDIFVIRSRGGGRLRLTSGRYAYEEQYSPVWSSDGRWIVFEGYDDGSYWISVVAADRRGERILTRDDLAEFDPAWAPDGRTIAFTKIHRGAVYAMRPDGEGRRVLARMRGSKRSWGLAWSAAGRRIAFFSDEDLWVMRADGTRPQRIVDSPFDKSHQAGYPTSGYLAWSPNGRKIAFSQAGEIFVVNADGSGLRNLTDNDGVDDDPVWSPDGRAIAFTSDGGGNSEIYVMNADGSGKRNVTQSPASDSGAVWSPTRR